MKAEAAAVLAADIHSFCFAAVTLNMGAERGATHVTADDLLDQAPPDVDLICAGEVCYEEAMADHALAWLRMDLAKGSRSAISVGPTCPRPA